MENWVGFRFSPTDEETVDHYVRLKNLGGDTSHVDKVMSTVDICSSEPWELPRNSRRESKDQVWYYFGRMENKYNRGDRQNRKTKSGSWKKTGVTTDIMRKRGNREKIGEKRVLVFQSGGSKSRSNWVMHEYIATFLPPTQITYTVCKVIFKGDASDLPSSSSSSAGEVAHSITHMNNSRGSENPRHFTGLLDAEKETQIDDAIRRAIFDNISTPDFNCFLNYNDDDDGEEEQEQGNTIMFMQEDPNDYKPKPSLTGFISGDDDSDYDLVSATKTVSITSLDASKEEYDLVQGTETGDYEMDQEVTHNKRTGFFYRKIRSCIKKTLLCSSISVKHDN